MCQTKAHEFLYFAASERDCVRELHCLAPDGRPALNLVVSEEYFNSKFNELLRTNESKLMQYQKNVRQVSLLSEINQQLKMDFGREVATCT